MNPFDQRLTPLLNAEDESSLGLIALVVTGSTQLLKTLLEAQLPQGNIDGVNAVWIAAPSGETDFTLDGVPGLAVGEALRLRIGERLWLRNREQIDACTIANDNLVVFVQLFTGSQGTTK